jgi:LysR family nitrogen assimilation transcriptional regulator
LPIVVPGHDHGLRRQLDRVAARAGVNLNIEDEVDSLAAIKELIEEGKVYTVLPIGCVYKEVLAGSLRAWRLVDPGVVNTMVLAAAQSRPFTAAMREVRMVLRDQVAIVAREQIGWRHRAVEEIRV